MPRVGSQTTIPAFERAKTVHGLDRAATMLGEEMHIQNKCFITANNSTHYKGKACKGKERIQ
jgi:hypothetical protein